MRNSILLATFFLLVIQAEAQEFITSTQKGVDLKSYTTFRVDMGEIVTAAGRNIDKQAFYNEFKILVVRELEGKGYVFAPDSAQLSVTYVVETLVQMESQNFGPLGGGAASPGYAGNDSHWSREFSKGMLIIDLEDIARKNTVWSATGTMDVTRARGAKLLDYCVRESFRKFPDKKSPDKKSKKNKE